MSEILKEDQQAYLDGLLIPSTGLFAEMESFAAENGIPILDKHASVFLESLLLIKKPMAVLEIGTAIGYSSIRIAKNLPEGASVTTIEKSKPNTELALSYIKRSGVGEKIRLLGGDALDILETHPVKYDFIFLDADKEDYKRLFDLSVPLLKPGGVMFVDNLLWHGYAASSKLPEKYKRSAELIREFNEYFLSFPGISSCVISVGDGLGIGIKTA